MDENRLVRPIIRVSECLLLSTFARLVLNSSKVLKAQTSVLESCNNCLDFIEIGDKMVQYLRHGNKLSENRCCPSINQ